MPQNIPTVKKEDKKISQEQKTTPVPVPKQQPQQQQQQPQQKQPPQQQKQQQAGGEKIVGTVKDILSSTETDLYHSLPPAPRSAKMKMLRDMSPTKGGSYPAINLTSSNKLVGKTLSGGTASASVTVTSTTLQPRKAEKVDKPLEDDEADDMDDEEPAPPDEVPSDAQAVTPKRHPFKCEFCPYSIGTANGFKYHYKTKHNGIHPFKCPKCDLRFPSPVSYTHLTLPTKRIV